MALTAEQLRLPRPRKTKMVHVPSWSVDGDDEVCIRTLTGREVAEMMSLTANGSQADYVLHLVARSIVDAETQERVFDDDRIEALDAMPGEGVRDLWNAAMQLNRMGGTEVEELAKNSAATAGDDSCSASPSTADTSTPG